MLNERERLMLAMLRAVEWETGEDGGYCPFCVSEVEGRHADGCPLAYLFRVLDPSGAVAPFERDDSVRRYAGNAETALAEVQRTVPAAMK
jgi:hypothetical protein